MKAVRRTKGQSTAIDAQKGGQLERRAARVLSSTVSGRPPVTLDVRRLYEGRFTATQILDAIMAKPDYDDPEVEERWCDAQGTVVAD
jgi:hypothetical protein